MVIIYLFIGLEKEMQNALKIDIQRKHFNCLLIVCQIY